ncbi:MAG: hypothetical protein ACUVWN_08940 [bacterium]
MWILILIISSLFYCFFIVLTFSLLRAGRKADEAEERILRIIQSESINNKENSLQEKRSQVHIPA